MNNNDSYGDREGLAALVQASYERREFPLHMSNPLSFNARDHRGNDVNIIGSYYAGSSSSHSQGRSTTDEDNSDFSTDNEDERGALLPRRPIATSMPAVVVETGINGDNNPLHTSEPRRYGFRQALLHPRHAVQDHRVYFKSRNRAHGHSHAHAHQHQHHRLLHRHNHPLQEEEEEKPLAERFEEKVRDWRRWPFFLVVICLVNTIMLIATIAKNNGFESLNDNPWAGPSVNTLDSLGAKNAYKIDEDHEVWRLFSPLFLSAGVFHWLFNLLFTMRCFSLEAKIGSLRLSILYILSGIGGYIVSTVFAPEYVTVGSSGALFGMAGGIIVYILRNFDYIPYVLFSFVSLAMFIVGSICIGLSPAIDNWSHIGGFVAGILISIIVVPELEDRAIVREKLETGQYTYTCSAMRIILATLSFIVLVVGYGVTLWAALDPDTIHMRKWCGDACKQIDCTNINDWWHCDPTARLTN